MKRFGIFAALGLITLLAACSEPTERPVARGDMDSINGVTWMAYEYTSPYYKDGNSYDYRILLDFTNVTDKALQRMQTKEGQDDVLQEVNELYFGLCGINDRDVQDVGVEEAYRFVTLWLDCK